MHFEIDLGVLLVVLPFWAQGHRSLFKVTTITNTIRKADASTTATGGIMCTFVDFLFNSCSSNMGCGIIHVVLDDSICMTGSIISHSHICRLVVTHTGYSCCCLPLVGEGCVFRLPCRC